MDDIIPVIKHRCTSGSECFCAYDPECNPTIRTLLMLDRKDPVLIADAEVYFEREMRHHQEPDGAYACDPHVMLTYALDALEAAASAEGQA